MSIFGKILTILNAVAAVVFLVLAGMDYSARQAWAIAGFRHELAINGLPLDDKDDAWRPGSPIARDLKDSLLNTIFQATGSPVRTQKDAIMAARNLALAEIESQPNDAKKREVIAAILLPLQTSSSARETLLAKDLKTNTIPVLQEKVAGLFNAAITVIDSKIDPLTKRARVADLLYNFNPKVDPKEREWVQVVVGLDQYVSAASRQADNLFIIAQRLDQLIKEEDAAFVRQYQDLTPRLRLLSEQLKSDAVRLDQQKKTLEQHNLLYSARRAERDELIDELRKSDVTAAAETANLIAVQKQLFELQREIADARAANERLETQIRTKEVGK